MLRLCLQGCRMKLIQNIKYFLPLFPFFMVISQILLYTGIYWYILVQYIGI